MPIRNLPVRNKFISARQYAITSRWRSVPEISPPASKPLQKNIVPTTHSPHDERATGVFYSPAASQLRPKAWLEDGGIRVRKSPFQTAATVRVSFDELNERLLL
jgi:hypothetical protein